MAGSESVLNNYLIVGALLFTLGLIGFLARRNLIVMFLCAELMLQGVSLTLVAFSAYHGTWSGQVFAIMSLALAAAEAGVALALIVVLFKRGHSLDVSLWQDLREPDQPPVPDESATDDKPDEGHWPHLPTAGRLPIAGSTSNRHSAFPVRSQQPTVGSGAAESEGGGHG